MVAQEDATGTNCCSVTEAGSPCAFVLEVGSVLPRAEMLNDRTDFAEMLAVRELGANSGALGDGVNSFGIAIDFALAAGVENSAAGDMFLFPFSFGSAPIVGDR